MPIKETFFKMRKSNCLLCDGYGVVTVVDDNNNEFGKACNCRAGDDEKNILKYGPFFDKLKYPLDMQLTEKENVIYLELIKNKKVKETPPWEK